MSEAEQAIVAMLLAFPQTAGDPRALLTIYLGDTSHIPSHIVAATAVRFRQGRVPKQSKQYAPTPAQFIEEAEQEHKLETLRNRVPTPMALPKPRSPYDIRLEAKRYMWRDYPVLFRDINNDEYRKLLKRGDIPHPHFFVACLGTVYGGLHPQLAGKPTPKPFSEAGDDAH